MSQGRESAALGIGEAYSLFWQLGLEHLIFCFEVGDDVLLVSIDPTRHHGDENLQNHGNSWGCEYRRAHLSEYTANPRDFNGVASANFFNTTFLYALPPESHLSVQNLPLAPPRT